MKFQNVILILVVFLQACSSSGTSNSSQTSSLTTSQKQSARQAVTAILPSLFSSLSSNVQANLNSPNVKFSTSSCDSNDPGCTCQVIRSGQTPIFIKATPIGTAASYGSSDDSITLASSDFCNDTSGNENSGSGTDGNGLYGSFEIRQDLISSCSSSSITLNSGSSGVFRNDSSGNVTLYGSFSMTISASTSSLDCTIEFDSSGNLISASCSDSSGTVIEADSSDSCSLSLSQNQSTIGACDVMGNPSLGIYDVNTTSTDTERTYIETQMDNYTDTMLFVRPHRVNGHVFSYNVVDEDGDGTYDWSAPDDVVKMAQDHNYKLFVNIYPEADDGDFDDSTYAVKVIELPTDTSGYSDFVTAMVERYDGDGYDDYSDLEIPIKHWAVANEPYCEENDTDCHEDILTLLELTYDAIKAADSDAVVFMGGAAPLYDPNGVDVNADVENLYQYIFDNGGLSHMDKFAFHTAVGRINPDLETYIIKYNSMMGSNALPMWLTETGSKDVGTGAASFDSDSATDYSLFEDYISAGLDFDDIEKAFVCNVDGLYDDSVYWPLLETYLDTL